MTSQFHNYSDAMLADAIGELAERRRQADVLERALKDEFRRRGVDRAAGAHFAVWLERDVAWIADLDAIKHALGEDAYSRCCRVQGRTRVRTKPANGEAPAAH